MTLSLTDAISVNLPSPLQEIHDDRCHQAGVRLLLKRDDLIHPDVPGNKWRKLLYSIETVVQEGKYDTLLTFGGAYSNHLLATAAAGHYCGFRTVGVVRGEEHLPLNPVLSQAVECGMHLTYLDRVAYREKTTPDVLARVAEPWGDACYILPEGGSTREALRGCAELPREITVPYDTLCIPCGTGGTLAGLATATNAHVLGFSVLKGGEKFLPQEVQRLQHDYGKITTNWSIEGRYHFGGFAKRSPELSGFIDEFERLHNIPLEWAYVAKMMYGIMDLIQQRTFSSGSTIIAVITGPPIDL